ncbi:hypothetical protein [Methylobacterium sp. JK268]
MLTLRTILVAAAAALSPLVPARAEPVKPAAARSLDLGPLAGVAYYTAEPAGYRVVVTLAPRAAAAAVRFEGVLTDGQSLVVSTPRQEGTAARAIVLRREGDTVSLSPDGEVQETAALR